MAQNPKDQAERNESTAGKFGQSHMQAEAQAPATAAGGTTRITRNAAGQTFITDPEGNAMPIPNDEAPTPEERAQIREGTPPAAIGSPETRAQREAREAAEAAEAEARQKAEAERMMARGEPPDPAFVAAIVEEKAAAAGGTKTDAAAVLLTEKVTEAAYLRRLLVAAMMRDHPFLRIGPDVMLRAEKQDVQISRNDDGSITVALVTVVA